MAEHKRKRRENGMTRQAELLDQIEAGKDPRVVAVVDQLLRLWMLGKISNGALHVAMVIAYFRLSPRGGRPPITRISDRDLSLFAGVKRWDPDGNDVAGYVAELEAALPQWFAARRSEKHRSTYTFSWPSREQSGPPEGGHAEQSGPPEGGQIAPRGDNRRSRRSKEDPSGLPGGGQSGLPGGGQPPSREGLTPQTPHGAAAGGSGGGGTPRRPAAGSPPADAPAARRDSGGDVGAQPVYSPGGPVGADSPLVGRGERQGKGADQGREQWRRGMQGMGDVAARILARVPAHMRDEAAAAFAAGREGSRGAQG